MGAFDWVSEDIIQKSNVQLLYEEIHVLSYFYHWSGDYCWSLPSSKRHWFFWRIREQIKAENKVAKGGTKK